MKNSNELLDRFQNDEEIRKKWLASGVIRLTPQAEVEQSIVLQIQGGKVIIVRSDEGVHTVHSGAVVVRPRSETMAGKRAVVKIKTKSPLRHKK